MNALNNWRKAIQEITMTKQLYLIEYENAHWCGGSLNVVVWATDEENAREVAESHMDECQRDLFSAEFDEEPELEEDCSYTINSVEEFNEAHDEWQFFTDPTQESFYPIVGEQF